MQNGLYQRHNLILTAVVTLAEEQQTTGALERHDQLFCLVDSQAVRYLSM